MHGQRGSPRHTCATVTDLHAHRAAVSTAAQVAVLLAITAGASFVAEHSSATACVVAVLPEDHVVQQRVRVVMHTNDEVAALYERFGRLPPARLRRTNV